MTAVLDAGTADEKLQKLCQAASKWSLESFGDCKVLVDSELPDYLAAGKVELSPVVLRNGETVEERLLLHSKAVYERLLRKTPPVSKQSERSTLINLPKPYFTPGGRFGEMYYWDTFFTLLGVQPLEDALKERGLKLEFPALDSETRTAKQLHEDALDNFTFLVNQFGFIPNGNRTYYLDRSQPPMFRLLFERWVILYCSDDNDTDCQNRERYQFAVKQEKAWWDANRKGADGEYHFGSNLNTPRPESFIQDIETASARPETEPQNVFRELRAGAESGWDFSSRWLRDPADLSTIQTSTVPAPEIDALLNGEIPQFWTVDEIRELLKPGGLATSAVHSGQQWDAPNGWAPLQWFAAEKLDELGEGALATEVRRRFCRTVEEVFLATGNVFEKYNVEEPLKIATGGEYEVQIGFGWTLGVYLGFTRGLR